jgi:hypothetical protein
MREDCYMTFTINIPMNGTSEHLEGKLADYTGGRSVTTIGRCGGVKSAGLPFRGLILALI